MGVDDVARRIVAIEIAGLGDLVHSLPALWALRNAFPGAHLDCLVHEPNASLLRLTPWIDHVTTYRRRRARGLDHQLATRSALRSQHYDLAVDLTGAELSSLWTRLSGAPHRWIRRPGPRKRRWAWRLFGTRILDVDFDRGPMYAQRLQCLMQAGLPVDLGPVPLLSESVVAAALSPPPPARPYLHLSPFTKVARKEPSPVETARLLEGLQAAFPDYALVVTSSAAPRELELLDRILALSSVRPDRVYSGTLDLPQLLSLIRGARLHLSGDTGSLHLAWIAGTPSVAWMKAGPGITRWAPQGHRHRQVSVQQAENARTLAVRSAAVLEQAAAALAEPRRVDGAGPRAVFKTV